LPPSFPSYPYPSFTLQLESDVFHGNLPAGYTIPLREGKALAGKWGTEGKWRKGQPERIKKSKVEEGWGGGGGSCEKPEKLDPLDSDLLC
jgi:hypothetical protein